MQTTYNIVMPRQEFKELIAGLMGTVLTDKGQMIEEIISDHLKYKLSMDPAGTFDDTYAAKEHKCAYIRQQISVANTILKHWDK